MLFLFIDFFGVGRGVFNIILGLNKEFNIFFSFQNLVTFYKSFDYIFKRKRNPSCIKYQLYGGNVKITYEQ